VLLEKGGMFGARPLVMVASELEVDEGLAMT